MKISKVHLTTFNRMVSFPWLKMASNYSPVKKGQNAAPLRIFWFMDCWPGKETRLLIGKLSKASECKIKVRLYTAN